MSVVAVAFVPGAPLLVPAVAAGSAAADEALRSAARAAVGTLLERSPQSIVIVGGAERSSSYEGGWDWSRLGLRVSSGRGSTLPLALGVGDWLLDDAGWRGDRDHMGIADELGCTGCAALGADLAARDHIAMLVVGDGTARRTEKAPGHFDPRAEAFDGTVAAALAAGDPEALLALDAPLATALLVAGRAPWQVLAGAARGARWRAQLLHEDAPYGVAYLVATWLREQA